MNYSTIEENWNVRTHAFGFFASLLGMVFLLVKANDITETLASFIFGMSLCILFLASTLYHSAKNESRRQKLRIFDHAAIYVLIAGTYTPVCLIPLKDTIGMTMLAVIWGIAIIGIVLKLFFTGKYDRASTIMYVAMGWVAVFAINAILQNIETAQLIWLLAGGIAYTLGAVIYAIRRIPYNHATFHVFVLIGSACHYIMIYGFIVQKL